jgi:class 3 adenylate cyclase/tetratricopeptide (TPR) repeat protein
VQVCSNCNHVNPFDARFCVGCGAELISSASRREERKIITALFADLVGFTSRAEQMDVEDVRAMLAPYHALVREQLERRDGTVEKFAGDAVMAVFGAPIAHEDDPERAVRAALAIREALAVSNERDPGLNLHVRIGVNTGEALVSLDASPATGESIASGDVVNTAARLQTAAPIDGVVVGEVTYRVTHHLIDYEQLRPVEAKGKVAPIACWQALRARASVGESRRRQDAAPLVGRRHELQTLVEAFERAKETRSIQTLTLVGVPGIGKSRLVRELFHDLDRRAEVIRWREGRSPPYGQGATFWALGEIVKAEAGIRGDKDTEAAGSKLAAAVTAVVDNREDAEWVERHLGALVGLGEEETLFGDRRAEAFAAWRHFIERLARRRPTVFVLDDIHWADDALLDFIEHLVAWASDIQLLVLCTARPELFDRRPAWGADSRGARVVALEPLSEEETHELFDALLGTARLPAETRSALLIGAAGNPLYAEEFVRMLIDRELLVQDDGEWRPAEVGEFPVPDSVLGIIAARLDALPPEDKAMMQDAAVIGKTFWPGAVASLADRGRWAIEEALRRLEQRQLIRRRHESSVAEEAEYAFEHALIRDVAYRTITRPMRAEKHARAAQWLSSLAGGVSDRADVVAHHYVTALDNAQASGQATPELQAAASKALQAAAERARALHSPSVAARLSRQALELCPSGDDRRPRLLLGLGKALALADEPAADILDEAAVLLLEAGDRAGAAEAESTNAWLLSVAGKPDQARARDRRALELVRDGAPSATKALILSSVGAHSVFVRELRDEALALLEEALSIANALELREIEAEALQFVGLARLDAGDEDGVGDIEKALSVATELNSPVALTCYGNLADVLRYLGVLKASAARHIEGERAAKRFGIPVQIRRFRAEQACDLYYTGDWDQALARLEEYLAAIESGSPHRGVGEARLHRGRIRLARGDIEGALGDAEAALRFARTTAEPFNLFPALAFHARVSLEPAPKQAEASVAELLDRLVAGQPFWGAWSLPQLLEVAGEKQLLELKRVLARAMPPTRWYEAVSAAIDGDHERAADLYAAMGARPEEARARVRAAEQALASGDMPRAHGQLEPALRVFTRVGAKGDVEHCNTLARGITV